MDPTAKPYDDDGWRIEENRKIAAAKVPPGVKREEVRGAVVLRWVDDPRDQVAVAEAAGRHETWMSKLIPTEAEED